MKSPISQAGAFLNIENDLPVVKDSTTSRVVVNNDLLRVVQFTFDAGQMLTEHSTPRAVVCILNSGQLEWQMGGEDHLMEAGDIIYLAPNESHALTALEASRLTLVMVNYEQ